MRLKRVVKIFIHIGTEKTGTTALQYFLKQNENILNQFGFSFYCETNKPYFEETSFSPGHFPLVAGMMNACPEFVSEKKFATATLGLQQLKVDILKKRKHAIISAEHFSSRILDTKKIAQLHHALDLFSIKIICYIRPQDELALASYSTQIKSGERRPFNPHSINKDSPYYNYSKMLEPWIKIFGKDNIILKKYNKHRLLQQDICRDFLKTIGIDEFSAFTFAHYKNKSLDASQLEVLRTINQYLPAFGEKSKCDYDEAQTLRYEIVPKLTKGKPITSLLSPYDRDLLLKKFNRSNKKIEHLFSIK